MNFNKWNCFGAVRLSNFPCNWMILCTKTTNMYFWVHCCSYTLPVLYEVHTFSGVFQNSLKNVAMIFSFMVNISCDGIYFWYVQIGAEVYSLLLEFFYTTSEAVCCNQGLQLVSKIFWSVNFKGARLITSRHQTLPQKSYWILQCSPIIRLQVLKLSDNSWWNSFIHNFCKGFTIWSNCRSHKKVIQSKKQIIM